MRNKTPFLSINFGFLLILIALQSVKKKIFARIHSFSVSLI